MQLDYSRDKSLSKFGIETLKDRYMVEGETSPQDVFARAARTFADDDAHAQRLYDYISKLWFMPSTPILSNGGTTRGMPISCFLNYVGDTRKDITDHYTENAFLSSAGGGIGTYWGAVRGAGKKSTGTIPFIKVVDAEMLAFSQGTTRRGSAAVYLDMSHPEIEEFLDIRKPTGGDVSRKSTNLHQGVLITDKFMELIEKATLDPNFDDSWDLIAPNTGEVVKTIPAKVLWIKLMQNRVELGEPYIIFIDTLQRALPDFQKALGLEIHHSNLCVEITLPTNEQRTAVCCLSSVNLEEWDQWHNVPGFIPDIMRFLDNVLQYFIENAPDEMAKARFSAERERSVGLGAMGFHAYLQRHNIAFESTLAMSANMRMFKYIKSEADRASYDLAVERGACPDAAEAGVMERFAHKMAIAPNASTSIICGDTSPSIEVYPANVYTQKTKTGSNELRNEYLEHHLEEIGMNFPEVWKDILANKGSVQHLDFLDEHTKRVFKTASEVDQKWVIEHAAYRQQYICQSQSLNLYFPADVHKLELHDVHMLAWKKGVKTLYYLRSQAKRKAEDLAKVTTRQKYKFDFNDADACLACEG
jgi:ribonucleoside-diphosphate reductase alpha chain